MTAITLDDFTAKQLGKCCQWDVPGRFAHEMDEEANIQRVASQVAAYGRQRDGRIHNTPQHGRVIRSDGKTFRTYGEAAFAMGTSHSSIRRAVATGRQSNEHIKRYSL